MGKKPTYLSVRFQMLRKGQLSYKVRATTAQNPPKRSHAAVSLAHGARTPTHPTPLPPNPDELVVLMCDGPPPLGPPGGSAFQPGHVSSRIRGTRSAWKRAYQEQSPVAHRDTPASGPVAGCKRVPRGCAAESCIPQRDDVQRAPPIPPQGK